MNTDRISPRKAKGLLASITAGALLCTSMLAGCSQAPSNGSAPANPSSASSQAGQIAEQVANDIASMEFKYSNRDTDASYDAASATKIELIGLGATVAGDGAQVSNSAVNISSEGTYVISGSAADAQIIIDAPDDAKVQLVLDGVTMMSNSGPCILANNADKVFVTLADGSANVLADGSWTLAGTDDEPNATLYSACDLTINGSGALQIDASTNHGVATKDDLRITEGAITIAAADDALHGKDSVSVNGGSLALTAGGDGIKTTKDDDPAKGFVTIDGGTIRITAADDGIQASRLIRTTGGSLEITSEDDALNSDLDILIDGGDVTVDAGDDAAHGEYFVDMVSGNFTADSCEEGLEGQTIDIAGGVIRIVANDDAINASVPDALKKSSSQQADTQGRGASPGMTDTSEDCKIFISAGVTTLLAEGDGIDSNGTLIMSGGEVYVFGPTKQGNGALDAGLGSTITGGTIIATSADGMEESFGSDSTQASIIANANGKAGDTISVIDANGTEIASCTAEREFTWVLASTSILSDGNTYTIRVNGTEAAATTASTQQQAFGMGGFGGKGMRGGAPGQGQDMPDRGNMRGGIPEQGEMLALPDGEMPSQGEMPSPPDGQAPPQEGMQPPQESQAA